MRKFIVAAVLAAAVAVPAHADGHGGHRGGGYGGGWVAPLIIGGIAGAVLAQPRYYYPPPVVYTTPPPYNPSVVYPDYTYRPMYKMVDVYVPECNCYRSVQVQIN